MKISKNKGLFIVFLVSNLFFSGLFFLISFLTNFTFSSSSEMQEIYPHGYKLVFVLVQGVNQFFTITLFVFLLVNFYFVYRLVALVNKQKEALLFLTVFFISLAAAEIILRKCNYEPGRHTYPRYFKTVDSLYTLDGFEADSSGIFRVSAKAKSEISSNIKSGNDKLKDNQIIEVYALAKDNIEMINGEQDSEIIKYYNSLKSKDSKELDDFETELVHYIHNPVNDDGFRSIAFRQYESKKPKVLLLGDSFTWGHSTGNKLNSFADILLARGFIVYNTGISATDVAQYLAIAQKFVPLLKPDFIVVNFYLGNDITYYKRTVTPFIPVFYPTNAGNLINCPFGECFKSANEAYDFYSNQWSIPASENTFNYLMSKTVITTLVWKLLMKLQLVGYGMSETAVYYNEAAKRVYKYPYCNKELAEIKKIATENGSNFILSSIPEVYTYKFNTKKKYPELFEGLDFIEMEVNKNEYQLYDGHFNDTGHKQYADFLFQHLKAGE